MQSTTLNNQIDKEALLRTPAPFIIQVVNSALPPEQATSGVVIGDSYSNRTASNFGQESNITISSGILGISYREMLAQSESQPFTVIATMIISSSAGQLDMPIGIRHKNASGDVAIHTITPTLTINQHQTDRVADGYEFLFDGFSAFRFSQINAGATVTVRMYTKEIFNATRILEGRNPIERFGNPRIW